MKKPTLAELNRHMVAHREAIVAEAERNTIALTRRPTL
jgi:hypothetical protein